MVISPNQFNEAYRKLPYTLREYIADDELTSVCEEVGKKFGLHVDTVGALYREATNMLIGLENPEQFMGELKSVGVPQEQIGPIVQELNQRVFIPLREKMQKEGSHDPYKENDLLSKELDDGISTLTEVRPVTRYSPPTEEAVLVQISQTPQVNAPAPSYAQTYAAPAPSISQFNSQVAPATQYVPQYQPPQPPVFQQQYATPAPAPRPVPQPPVNLPGTGPSVISAFTQPAQHAPEVRTMAKDMSAMNSGTYESTPIPIPVHAQPTAPVAFVPAPSVSPVPSQSSWSLPPVPIAHIQPAPTVTQPSALPKSPNQADLHQVLAQYGIDPYREPVE